MAKITSGIRGISRTTLWASWKEIRRELKSASIRDVIDFLDYDIDPEIWITRLVYHLAAGTYEPGTPRRFTLGKSKGFSRTMTMPAIPDLVLYRTIVDQLRKCSRKREHTHVYFLRSQLHKVQSQVVAEARAKMASYKTASSRSFVNWLRYDQYRKHLIVRRVGRYFVVADVANFFDSILHTHLSEALQGIDVPPQLIGLLFFLLERLSIRQDYSSSRGISLPVDEFDCSRTLAHMVLYPHDQAMVNMVGEENYVRWMDDQNMVVDSRGHALQVLAEVGRSLSRLHLTPNTQKSKILTLSEARRHFHLDLNAMLDKAEEIAKDISGGKAGAKKELRRVMKSFWRRARSLEQTGGEFGKILKRTYRLTGLAGMRFLRGRASKDALTTPDMIDRICSYMRCTGSSGQYVEFVFNLLGHPEQVYPDVRRELIEGLLRMEPESNGQKKRIRMFASDCLRKPKGLPEEELAALLILRFADRRSLPLLRRSLLEKPTYLSSEARRACALVYASYGSDCLKEVRRAASQMMSNPLVQAMRLLGEVKTTAQIHPRIKARLALSRDSVAGINYVDMRIVLISRLLLLSRSAKVRGSVIEWRDKQATKISLYDIQMLKRLVAP